MYAGVMRYGSIRQIEAFRCLMITGNMASAAKMMGVTQPAVSRLLKDLQADLQLSLFRKSGTRLEPTPEAIRLHAEVERSFIGLERVHAAAEEIRTRRDNSLKIAAMPALAIGVLSRFAGDFMASRPQLDMELASVISPSVVGLVADRLCDLGFAYVPIANPGLHKVSMPPQAQVAVLPSGHRLVSKPVLTPPDFEGEDFVALKQGAADRRRTDEIFSEHGVSRRVRVETPTSAVICAMVASGFGIGICDPFTASNFTGRGIVVRRFRPKLLFKFAAFFPPTSLPSPIAQEFLDEFGRMLRAWKGQPV